MQVVETAVVTVPRHAGILYPEVAHMPQNGMYAPPAERRDPYALEGANEAARE